MKTINSVLTANEIRTLSLNKDDVMGYSYIHHNSIDNYYLTINGKEILSFTNPNSRRLSFEKIRRMGLGWKAPQLTYTQRIIIHFVGHQQKAS